MSWPMGKVSDIAEVISGYAFKSEWFGSGDTKVIRIGDLKNGRIDLQGAETFDVKANQVRDQFRIRRGDILMALSGATVGKIAVADSEAEGAYLNQRVAAIRGLHPENSEYLKFVFAGSLLQKLLLNAGGAAQPNLSPKDLAGMEIPLPSLIEQKRIATILDKADAIGRKRQQAIQLADEFLRAVFLDMFGPSADNVEWREVSFEEVALIDAIMVDPREAEYLDLLHIGPDRVEKNTGKLLPALTAKEENLISKKFLFDQSYVLYSKIRPNLRKVALPDFSGLCSADMYPVRPKEGLMTREYLWQLLLSDEFTQYTQTLPARANIPKLNRSELTSFSFKLPPIDLQRKFSKIFETHNKFLSVNNSALKASEETFAALSQKVFAGHL